MNTRVREYSVVLEARGGDAEALTELAADLARRIHDPADLAEIDSWLSACGVKLVVELPLKGSKIDGSGLRRLLEERAVNARLWTYSEPHFVHAKLVAALQGETGRLLSGSANLSYVALLANGHLQIRRTRGGATTVLGDVASGIADLSNWSTIGLSATGSGPVQLVASVNGTTKLTVTDSSTSAVVAAGTSGISTQLAGVSFDDFVVQDRVSPQVQQITRNLLAHFQFMP